MNVFEVVKENVTARQAAEAYGLKVGRTGMACCPFHSDKSPSMKLDERYYCFGCGATGDAVDLTAKLFGIGLREAAVKLAEDFGLNYDSRQKPSVRPRIREPTPEQKYQKGENHCYKVLTDYFHLLREWEKKYAPKQPDEEWNPLFAEALYKKNYMPSSTPSTPTTRNRPTARTAAPARCRPKAWPILSASTMGWTRLSIRLAMWLGGVRAGNWRN